MKDDQFNFYIILLNIWCVCYIILPDNQPVYVHILVILNMVTCCFSMFIGFLINRKESKEIAEIIAIPRKE